MDGDITKRMGVNIGKAFTFGEGDEGRRLPVYSIEAGGSGRLNAGCGTSRAYKIETTGAYGWPDGRPMYHAMAEGSQ